MRRFLITLVYGLLASASAWADGAVPRPSPEYAVKLTTGQQLLLSQYRGKVVALMFVATTCPHCQQTCRLMEKLSREYGPLGFQPLAVAFNDMAMMLLPDFVKQANVTFPIGYDLRDTVFAYLDRSPILKTFVPIQIFIDRNGVIRAQHLGDDQFLANQERNTRTIIEQLLKEPAGGKSSPKKPS